MASQCSAVPVDFWLRALKDVDRHSSPALDKEALSTAVILWRRSGNAAGLPLETGPHDAFSFTQPVNVAPNH